MAREDGLFLNLVPRLLLALYPSDFRLRRGEEFLDVLRHDLSSGPAARRPLARASNLADALLAGLRLRLRPDWTSRFRIQPQPPSAAHAAQAEPATAASGGPHSVPPFTPQPGSSNMFDQIRQDLAFAFRNLIRRPGWTLAAVATLALGIGATTAVFSMVNDVLLRPLPYPQAERLVELQVYIPEVKRLRGSMSFPVCQIVSEAQEALTDFGCFNTTIQTVEIESGAERMRGALMTWQILRALQVSPLLGRAFTPQDDEPGAEKVVLISHGLWQERYGGDRNVVGRELRMGENPFTIVGVMPPGFVFPDDGPRFWVSLAPWPRGEGNHYLRTLGRLEEGWTQQQAWAHFETLTLEVPTGSPGQTGVVEVHASTLMERLVGEVRPQLWIFLSAVAAVLLIACINVANLLLSRMAGRRREMALRSALGAGRRRLLLQMLSESTLLGLLSGLAGMALALLFSMGLRSLASAYVPRTHLLGVDASALLFAAGLSLLVGILIGLLPALRASRPDVAQGLSEAGRGSAGTLQHHRLRAVLVVAQVALALTLLINAGLLVRSFQKLASTDVGFDTADLLTIDPALPSGRYGDSEATIQFFDELVARLQALPGVEGAALTATLPFDGGHIGEGIWIEGADLERDQEGQSVDVQVVGPGFFQVLGLGPQQGRLLDERDVDTSTPAAVVNETFVRQVFPGGDVLGQRLTLGSYDRRRQVEIVGVVPDVMLYRLTREIRPMLYESVMQNRRSMAYSGVLARTRPGAASGLVPQARSLLQSIDAGVPLRGLPTVEAILSARMSNARFRTLILSAFGITALLLSVIGVYGVMAYSVAQRTREIGVRMALGAHRRQILLWVVRRGLLLTAIGLILGVAGAQASSTLLKSYLHQLSINDVLSYSGALLLLFLAAMLAAFLPARRASRTDPMEALRCE